MSKINLFSGKKLDFKQFTAKNKFISVRVSIKSYDFILTLTLINLFFAVNCLK